MKKIFTHNRGSIIQLVALFCFLISGKISAQTYLFERFNGNTVPPAWTITDGGSGLCKWFVHAPGIIGTTNINMRGSNFLFVNSDSAGVNTVANETITSQDMAPVPGSTVFLEFFQYYRDRATNTDTAIVEVFNGTNWIRIQNRFAASLGTGTQPTFTKINISTHVNAALKVRFRYRGNRGFYWAIDDIKIYTPPTTDVGVTAINDISPCGLPNFFPVKVRIKNFGTQAQSNIPVSYKVNNGLAINQTLAGSIPAGDSTVYTFSVPFQAGNPGAYNFSVWTSLPGDQFSQNDSLINVKSFKAAYTPSFVDFSGFTGPNLGSIFPGWTQKGGSLSSDTSSLWTNSNDDQTAFYGSTTARLNLYEDTRQEWIISPSFSPVANSILRFKMALTVWNNITTATLGEDDSLIVKVSTDCGSTWETLQAYTFDDNLSNNLSVFSIPLDQYTGQIIQIAFYGTDGLSDDLPDNDIHIDDIEVLIPSPIDARLTRLVLPGSNCGVGNSYNLKVQVTNNGNAAITSIPLSCQVTGQTVVNQTFNQNIAPNATVTLSFSTPLQFPLTGVYFVSAWSSLAGDGNVLNDSLKNKKVTKPGIGQFIPVNFTAFTGTNLSTLFPLWKEQSGQVPTGTFSSWENSSSVQTTQFGTTTAKVNLWQSTKKEWIVSPVFEPTANTTLKFKVAVTDFGNTDPIRMGSDDSVIVRVSNDCGISWTNLKVFTVSNNLSNQLTPYQTFLGQYAGQAITIAFFATEGTVNDPEDTDFHLDDISLGVALTNDISLDGLDIPNLFCGISSSFPLRVRVSNFGTSVQNSIILRYSINGQAPVEQTFSQTINGGSGALLTFTNVLQFPNQGTYNLSVWAVVANDENINNDSLKNVLLNRATSVIPVIDFNNFDGFNLSTIYPGWLEKTGANPGGTTSSWTTGTVLQTTALGSGSTASLNINSSFSNNWLVGPNIVPQAGSVLKFKAAIMRNFSTAASTMGADDSVNIKVSTNCGSTWLRVRSFTANSAPGNQFTEYSISLAAYAGQNISIGFQGTSGTVTNAQNYNFHIDNIQVVVPLPNDVGISNLILPSGDCGLPTVLNLSVIISNFGIQPQTGFPINYQVNNLPVVTQTFGGNIAAGGSATFSFTQSIDLTISNPVKLKVWTNLTGDQLPQNDTISATLIQPSGTVALCDFNNFDGDNLSTINPGWKESVGNPPTGITSSWLVSTTSQASAHGSNTARMGYFGNTRREWIITPVLSPVSQSILNISVAVTNRSSTSSDIMGSDDSLNIMVTTNCGQSWLRVKSFTAGDQLSNNLTAIQIPLATFVSQRIQIGFFATEGMIDNQQDYDFHIDNAFVSINTSDKNEIGADHIILFPNPVSTILQIKLNQNSSGLDKIEMFSAEGKSITSRVEIQNEKNGFLINVANLSEGLYFVRLPQKDMIVVKSFIVKH